MPSWQDRIHPKVEDYDVNKFGSTVPAKVLNPDTNPVKAIEAGKMGDASLPRFVVCFTCISKDAQWSLIIVEDSEFCEYSLT